MNAGGLGYTIICKRTHEEQSIRRTIVTRELLDHVTAYKKVPSVLTLLGKSMLRCSELTSI